MSIINLSKTTFFLLSFFLTFNTVTQTDSHAVFQWLISDSQAVEPGAFNNQPTPVLASHTLAERLHQIQILIQQQQQTMASEPAPSSGFFGFCG